MVPWSRGLITSDGLTDSAQAARPAKLHSTGRRAQAFAWPLGRTSTRHRRRKRGRTNGTHAAATGPPPSPSTRAATTRDDAGRTGGRSVASGIPRQGRHGGTWKPAGSRRLLDRLTADAVGKCTRLDGSSNSSGGTRFGSSETASSGRILRMTDKRLQHVGRSPAVDQRRSGSVANAASTFFSSTG